MYETKKNPKYFLFWTIFSGAAGKNLIFWPFLNFIDFIS